MPCPYVIYINVIIKDPNNIVDDTACGIPFNKPESVWNNVFSFIKCKQNIPLINISISNKTEPA